MDLESLISEGDDPTTLQKLLRLQCKNMNFLYEDECLKRSLKINYPGILSNWKDHTHPIQVFWLNIKSIYLHKITTEERQRICLFIKLTEEKVQQMMIFEGCLQFQKTLKLYLNENKIKEAFLAAKNDLDSRNWLTSLFLLFKFFLNKKESSQSRFSLEAYNEIKEFLASSFSEQERTLKKQNRLLKNLMPKPEESSDSFIQKEIKSLNSQLRKVKNRNNQFLSSILEKVNEQKEKNRMVYILNGHEAEIDVDFSPEKDLYERIEEIQTIKNSLKLDLRQLEKRQIFDSIAKVVSVEKREDSFYFTLELEKAMNKPNIIVSEQQFLQIEQHRYDSLLEGYQTGIKSTNNFIYSNINGFRQIIENPRKQCKFQTEKIDMFEELKRERSHPATITDKFIKYGVCHECMCLCQKPFLKKCSFVSKTAMKENDFVDSYFKQASILNPGVFQIPFQNYFLNYSKFKGIYKCEREYCFNCIKQYKINDFLDGNCFFCRNKCQCRRCLRQERIKKMKKIYHSFGGLISDIYCHELYGERKRFQSIKKEEREPNEGEIEKKAKALMKEMDHLRILADIIKKREKKKLKINQMERERFHLALNALPASKIIKKMEPKGSPHEDSSSKKRKRPKNDKFLFLI